MRDIHEQGHGADGDDAFDGEMLLAFKHKETVIEAENFRHRVFAGNAAVLGVNNFSIFEENLVLCVIRIVGYGKGAGFL